MFNNFLTVFSQVVVLFILMATGFAAGKFKILSDSSTKALTDFVLYFASPCMIVQSYIREFKNELLYDMLISILISFLIHIGAILLVSVLFRKNNKGVMRFATLFSNAGYMALPLQKAVLGDMGVFLGASYVAVFNLFLWTYGIICMKKDEQTLPLKKIFLNPGVLSVIAGIIIFVFSVPLPEIITSAVGHLANLNTPLPMIIIGYYLSTTKIKDLFTNKIHYILCFVRLIFIPALCLFIMVLCGVRGNMLYSMVIAVSAPTAAATTMFCVKYGHDAQLSVSVVSMSTLLSLITMPVLVALAMYFG